ncbi:MAG TPA: GIY-YIG nuclease family protein [Caulobacteraceae bacterium]|jgi:putative endonuclease
MKRPFIAVYLLTNRFHGMLYTGVTSNLFQRMDQHREGRFPGFTKVHGLKRLVWFQTFDLITEAIPHEKRIKRYRREFKYNLIERDNPHWDDLFEEMMRDPVWKLDYVKEEDRFPNPLP